MKRDLPLGPANGVPNPNRQSNRQFVEEYFKSNKTVPGRPVSGVDEQAHLPDDTAPPELRPPRQR